ncbi:hypothetical protein RhiirA1_470090 [Rhizophagus irregularis]|uniref:Uncharacterized protein n=1 Tax=Rhizophagus irregularis TaxID=588596 RepID=A0A2N0R6R9_9GLOM|nr:hypothetical protein RhiirA1_470090 [Rhizophagus irregularis]
MGGELKLAFTLAVQMNNYDDFKSPYNFPYIDELQTPQLCASYTWPDLRWKNEIMQSYTNSLTSDSDMFINEIKNDNDPFENLVSEDEEGNNDQLTEDDSDLIVESKNLSTTNDYDNLSNLIYYDNDGGGSSGEKSKITKPCKPSLINHRNIAYNILKYLENDMVENKEIPELEQCSELCIEKQLLHIKPSTCPFPDCEKNVDIIVDLNSIRRGSQSSQSSRTLVLTNLIGKKVVLNSPIIPEEGRRSDPIDVNSNGNVALMNVLLSDYAEKKNENATQNVINRYFTFGETLYLRYKELKPSYDKDRAKALVEEEVRKQIPEIKFSDEALRKRWEKSEKAYKLFNSIGKLKIE